MSSMKHIKIFEEFSKINEVGFRPTTSDSQLFENSQKFLNNIFFKELNKSNPDLELINNFLSNKLIDINAKGNWNRTCLHYSVYQNHINLAEMFIELGIDIDSNDIWKKTALHLASYYNRIEIIQMLLNRGAKTNVVDEYGKTPWDYADESLKNKIPGMNPKNKKQSL